MSNSINQQILFKGRPVGEPKRVISFQTYPRTRRDEVLNRTITYLFTPTCVLIWGKNTTGWFNLALQRRKSSAGSNLMPLLVKHALIKGFLVGDYHTVRQSS